MPTLYKPQTRKGPVVILEQESSSAPTITLADGTVITAVRADRAGGTYKGHEGFQWVFPRDVLGQQDAVLTVDGKTQELGNTNMAYRGSGIGSLQESRNGAIGDLGREAAPGSYQTVGEFGVAPNYIGDQFPSFTPIEGAASSYQYIDPIKFGEQFTPFQRTQLTNNFRQAGDFALDAIDTEFQALASFVPRSAALKRDVISEDNRFNQEQRTAQLRSAIPDVVEDLTTQAADARAFARGEIPDAITDRGLEIGVRSEAADLAASGGFGLRSSAARKTSDLMSARERLGIAQYGNNLLSSNAAQRAQLFLAPTSYSNAGESISAVPSISGSQLQQSNAAAINNAITLPSTTAFSTNVQQSQFLSNLIQQTQQFNATRQDNFALSFFNYLNSYVNSLAAAGQTNINTGVSLEQQEAARLEEIKQRDRTQRANTIESAITGAVAVGMNVFSDIRLKENINRLSGAIDIINRLPVYRYTYKEKTVAADGKKEHIGILAQDLQRVLPTSVGQHSSGFLQIDPAELLYVLVAAITELNERLTEYEAKSAQ